VAHLDTGVVTAGAMETPFLPRLNLIRAPRVTMPVQCRQCDDAPCANVCPVEAIVQRDDSIVVKAELCIGCKTCMLACPFGAVDVVPCIAEGEPAPQPVLHVRTAEGEEAKGVFVAQKCDLCPGRTAGPACVEVCPAEAFVVVNPAVMRGSTRVKRIAGALEVSRRA
jgi:electron transport protein HydN